MKETMQNRPILLVGITGMLGSQIANELLDAGAALRATVRSGGYDGEKAKTVDALREKGLETFEADFTKPDTLASALDRVDTVVSALQGLGAVIVDAQVRLLRAAEKAGARRMVPSDFSVDLFNVPPGENRNFDLRRTFAALLDGSKVEGTSILNGAFTDMLTMGYPVLHADEGIFDIWGDGQQPMDFTSVADTAKYTAAAVMDVDTPRILRFAADTPTLHELHDKCEVWLGKSLEKRNRGSISDLADEVHRQMAEHPGDPDSDFPVWQGLQYLHNMVSGKAKLEPLDNERYSQVEAEDVASFLSHSDLRN